ncbi:MAG: hypothetical protein M5U35_10600 [Roseovarius sp.]|nr:hypothetical protein [Roseovarius sp.]
MSMRGYLPVALVLAGLALLPVVIASNEALNFIVFALIIALTAHGWNLLGGMGGQLSFGHAAFFGTGAYVSAILQIHAGLNPGRPARWRWRQAGRWAGSSAFCHSAPGSGDPISRWSRWPLPRSCGSSPIHGA